ncbi:junctophilin-1 isoform X1 [Cimex lectularius]|uniref:Junctophilin n=2 Tax=Cimex lectularius TaxID=79782 RepID=A0A8I6RK81_CIMLE|nr:junctophilin-1 isoform X1 [Cimex lectularius]
MDEPATGATGTATSSKLNGGRFDFDDGGTFLGGWEDGKAHGHGVCTGPKGQGAYSGSWHYGFEVSGVYIWPSGSAYEGQWQNGKRHGLGVESRGRWMYRGEWTQGFKGRYGVRQSSTSNAKYEGTWANGLQDGYGSETYADGGTYQGQWLRGMRHGYGVRASAPFGQASHYRPNKSLRASLTSLRSVDGAAGAGGAGPENAAAAERDRRVDDSRGGFVLKAKSDEAPVRRRSLVEKSSNIKKSILSGLKIRKQRSTGDLEKRGTSGGSIRSTGSSASWVSTESSQSGVTGSLHTDSNASFVVEDEHMDASVTETYLGEWKNDKRSGFGISERSDGLKYEGEWFNNKKYGYGVTTFRDGSKEEGKYKNNVLITSQKKKHLFLIRSAKFRERIDAAVNAAQRASKIALQKADIAISRTATARGKAELADLSAEHAREDFEVAQNTAKQFAPDFIQPGLEKLRNREMPRYRPEDVLPTAVTSPPKVAVNSIPNKQQHARSREGSVTSSPASKPTSATTGYETMQTNAIVHQQDNYYPNHQPPQPQPQYTQQQQQYHQEQLQLQQQYQQQYQNQDAATYQHVVTPPTPLPSNKVERDDLHSRQTIRRNSRQVTGESPSYNFQQAMSDHFDHYKRAPSRDGSVDRYARGSSRLSGGPSRQPSIDKTPAGDTVLSPQNVAAVQAAMSRAPSVARAPTPSTGNGSVVGALPLPRQTSPFVEEVAGTRRRGGQEVVPSITQPKRTESLYIAPNKKEPAVKAPPVNVSLQRKKSLPDVQGLPSAMEAMSREEVSVLSSARREEVRRMQDEAEKLRANPLLYLVSPHVKEWFSRQQLVMLVLFVNISLAIMFFKLLT